MDMQIGFMGQTFWGRNWQDLSTSVGQRWLLPSKGSRDETAVMAQRLLALNHWLQCGKQPC